MADDRTRVEVGPLAIRIASGNLFLPDDIGARVSNLCPTEEGTLRSVEGPLPLLPDYATGGAPASATEADVTVPQYGDTHGVFHATLGQGGPRDILLVHTGTEIWEFEGWNRGWSKLIGFSAATETAEILNSKRPDFPTQFEATQNGIVIVPQNARAYFYDGTTIAPLGYTEAPGAPVGHGPSNSLDIPDYAGVTDVIPNADEVTSGKPTFRRKSGTNDADYARDALQGRPTGMIASFGHGRLGLTRNPTNFAGAGTIVNPVDLPARGTSAGDSAVRYNDSRRPIDAVAAGAFTVGGWLEPGAWRCRAQFVDQWGNLSPLSGESNEVTFEQQYATDFVITDKLGTGLFPPGAAPPYSFKGQSYVAQADRARKQIAWSGLDRGPRRTIGRILYRTQDLKHSGTAKYFALPLSAMGAQALPITLPDNVVDTYPDNIPDPWLTQEAPDVAPVPVFKLCRVAFGRLWAANTKDAPGLLHPSVPGLWGTFLRGQEMYPDPRGAEITGLWHIPQGLLVFTEGSTYLVTPNTDGTGFTSVTISSEVGCTAPNSVRTLKTGVVVWLGTDGFYAFSGVDDYSRGVTLISTDVDTFVDRVTQSRRRQACAAVDNKTGEYRCWVSFDGGISNNRCFIYDGVGWRTRTDVGATDVCVTRDHRDYMVASGKVGNTNGVWVLDHEAVTYGPVAIASREAVVETAWLTAATSKERKTGQVLYLWLRETANLTLTIEVMRDWRNTVIETTTATRYAGDDVPDFWSETALGSDDLWQKKRPYWTRAAVYIPSAEVFKFRIRGVGKWEFVGVQIAESLRGAGGARIPP